MAQTKKTTLSTSVPPVQTQQQVTQQTTTLTDVKQVKKSVATKVSSDKSDVLKDAKQPKSVVDVVSDIVENENVQANIEEAPKDNLVSTIIEKVNTLFVSFKEVQALLKVLSKEYDKQQKIIEKAQKKRQNAKNSPSGFAKPNKISDELCDFIGVPHGTEKSRTDITRFINTYVKEHNLNKPENKRFILPDDKLKKILNVGDKEDINYFILQKLISHHFPPSASKQAQIAA
jgi:chromatin remodeling complex protein RSC6